MSQGPRSHNPAAPYAEPASASPGRARTLALGGWVLFDWAAQPFYTLVTTFVFAPYFANIVVGNKIEGQALWGYGAATAGILVALISPVLGAVADASGRRKPWIALFSAFLILALSALWFAVPGASGRVPLILATFVIAAISAELATVFTNAMMPSLVGKGALGRLSGIGWAVGYAGGLLSLVLMAGLIVVNPQTGTTLMGLKPLFALDGGAHIGDRLVGPFSALWYAVFVIPLFLFTPDLSGARRPLSQALWSGLDALVETVRQVRRYRNIGQFLIARMIYIDGLAAIFTFGGIYAAAIFSWGAFALGLYGIILTVAAAIGAVLGGVLDDKVGAKPVILLALVLLMAGALGVVSIDRTHMLFFLPYDTVPEPHAPFSSAGEQAYLVFAVVIGLAIGPLQSASRSLLARLAPPDQMTEFFGLYAFSGKVTAFAAPLAVGLVTDWSGNQRAGVAVILVFLLAGFALILRVRTARG